jgi:hypothetical protein
VRSKDPRTIQGRRELYGVTNVKPEKTTGPSPSTPTSVSSDESSAVPNTRSTKADIQAYLDAQSIAYDPAATKADLLALVGA